MVYENYLLLTFSLIYGDIQFFFLFLYFYEIEIIVILNFCFPDNQI